MCWLLLIFISSLSFFAQAQSCPTKTLLSPLTPEKLQSFLRNSKIKKVEDLVCCLPAEYLNNYAVIHSSFAFQGGTPEHPRVILHNPVSAGNDFDMAITITGDDKSLNAANHVEVLFNNTKAKQAELYDIDFEQKKKFLSDKNPKQCLGCHGPNAKDIETAGIKPIFTDSPWPYAVGGVNRDDSPETTHTYFRNIDTISKNAIQTQPRYACLQKHEDIQFYGNNVVSVDAITTDLNNRRVAKLMLSTPDYARFRPLIVGATLHCLPEEAKTKDGLKAFEKEFAKWISPGVDRAVFYDDQSLQKKYRNVDNLYQAMEDFNHNEVLTATDAVLQKRAKQKPDDKGKSAAIFYPTSFYLSVYDNGRTKHFPNDYDLKSLSGFAPTSKLYARYQLDTLAQHGAGNESSSLLRFLFESRGIKTLTWSKGMAGDYKMNLGLSALDLRDVSPDDAFWKQIGPLADLVNKVSPNVGNQGVIARQKACAILQKQSFLNFSNGAAPEASSSTSAPTRGTN